MTLDEFMTKVFSAVIQPLLVLVFGLAFIIFVWGIFQYIRNGDETKGREEGQRGILWGLLGMVIMTSSFGIINIIQGTIGVEQTSQQRTIEEQFESTTGDVRVEGR